MLIPIDAGKKPLVRWKSSSSAAALRTEITLIPRWKRAKIAAWARIIPEGEVVLDLDDGGEVPDDWPPSAELWTSRGPHVWYRSAGVFTKWSVNVGGRKVDICPSRTLEVIVAPDRHFINAPIVALPEWLAAAIGPRPSRRGEGYLARRRQPALMTGKLSDTPPPLSRYVRKTLDQLFKLVASAPMGHRNSRLSQAAYRCGQLAELGVTFEKAEGMLLRAVAYWDEDPGRSEMNVAAVIACGYEAGLRAR